MKLLISNGAVLTVYNLEAPLMQFTRRADGPPIKVNGTQILEDAAAKDIIRTILASDLYDRVPL